MAQKSTGLSGLVNMNDHRKVLDEVRTILRSINPRFDFSRLDRAHSIVSDLFAGRYPGYRGCNTLYHDLSHTIEIMLAMTRLIHGAMVEGADLTEKHVNLGVISALMHDTGYIQTLDDTEGTGAKYTLTHIQRSVDFTGVIYARDPYFGGELDNFRDILFCTGLGVRIALINFSTPQVKMLGHMLGTADLLGQMARCNYPDKLVHLYREFVEGQVPGFESEFDLLNKTQQFQEVTEERFENELGRAYLYSAAHFRARWGIDRDLYREEIEKNLAHIKWALESHPTDYRRYLQRKP